MTGTLNALLLTLKSEIIHMVVACGKMESEVCSPVAVTLLAIC